METMRRLFVLLAAVGLCGTAVGCCVMGKCDCDGNLGCGSCGICSGVVQKNPYVPGSHKEPPEALPKPMEKGAEKGAEKGVEKGEEEPAVKAVPAATDSKPAPFPAPVEAAPGN